MTADLFLAADIYLLRTSSENLSLSLCVRPELTRSILPVTRSCTYLLSR